MRTCKLLRSFSIWAVASIIWPLVALADELSDEDLAAFLPEPLPGYTTREMGFGQAVKGPRSGLVYHSDVWSFQLSITLDAEVAARIQGLIDNMAGSGQTEIVPVGGIDLTVLFGECFAVLPGDIVLQCTSFGEEVEAHIETIDIEALLNAASN